MKKTLSLVFLFSYVGVFSQSAPSEAIHYISLNNAIHSGQFDGISPVKWVRDLANFGVGSEEKLRSEVIVLDGSFYKVTASGELTLMKGDDQLAYAALKQFTPDTTIRYEKPFRYDEVLSYLDKVIDLNGFSAIRIDALFDFATFRCYAEQTKPYKPIDEVPEIIFTKQNVRGTLVGFYTPKSANVMNSPAYHFHFIDDEHKNGGHFKTGILRELVIQVDYAQAITIHLPPVESLKHIDLNKVSPN
jgi:acetolactate decarboxylase